MRANDDEAIDGNARAWKALAPKVPDEWFARRSGRSSLHGARHTQRVHIHAQRLTTELGWPEPDPRLALSAALWHDIGRLHDGKEPEHGRDSARHALNLGLTKPLAPADAELALFAVAFHSLRDEEGRRAARGLAQPERALGLPWMLKDADALDRVRLGGRWAIRTRELRFLFIPRHIGFADELLRVFG